MSLKNILIKRFFNNWLKEKKKREFFLILLSLLLLSFLGTKILKLELKYQALNPVHCKKIWKDIIEKGSESKEYQKLLSAGSLAHAETLYLPPNLVLRAISLGYQTFLADLLFIRAHSYFLTHFFTDRIFEWLDNYVEGILSLDENNPKVYLWASQIIKYGQIINNKIINKSNEYLEKGIKRFPHDWRFYERIGFNLFFEYKPETEQERNLVREKALQNFSLAVSLPGAKIPPNFITDLFLKNKQYKLAIEHAFQLYYEVSDEEKEQIRRLISEIEKGAVEEIKKEEEEWRKNFPYTPIHLFGFLGEKINPYKSIEEF